MKKQTKRIIKALIVSGGLIIFVIGAILNNGFMLGIGFVMFFLGTMMFLDYIYNKCTDKELDEIYSTPMAKRYVRFIRTSVKNFKKYMT